MATMDNLQAAFAGESQANRKYLAYAKKAEADGLPQVAKLFRAAAEAETVHAHAHYKVMGGINDTASNLDDAISGENYEFTQMYPGFLEEAEKEGNSKAATSFKYALAVEEVHHGLYSKAREAVASGKDMAATTIYVCPVCGNTVEGDRPDTCDVCNVPGSRFLEIK